MKAMKIITALLLTAALGGCNGEDVDIRGSETLPMTETAVTELTDSMTAIETAALSNEEAAAPENSRELIDTLILRGYRIALEYEKVPGELGEFYITSYPMDDYERKEPLGTVRFHESPGSKLASIMQWDKYLTQLTDYDYFIFSTAPDVRGGTFMLFDINEYGMVSLYSYEGGYEIPGENFGMNGMDYDGKHRLFDYGARRYTEYSIDPVNKAVTLEGALEFRPDIDMTYLVMRADCVLHTFTGRMTRCKYAGFLTEESSEGNMKYYRVSQEFAVSADELREMIDTAFTEEAAAKCFTEDPFTPPDDDTPAMFTEDGEGVIYAEAYSGGIEGGYDYDTVRLVTENNDPDTATVTVMNTSPYYCSLIIMDFDMSDSGHKLKDIRGVAAGAYFLEE